MVVEAFAGLRRSVLTFLKAIALVSLVANLESCAPETKAADDADMAAARKDAKLGFNAIDDKAKGVSGIEESVLLQVLKENAVVAELGGEAAAKAKLQQAAISLRKAVLGAEADLPRFLTAADNGASAGYQGLGAAAVLLTLISREIGTLTTGSGPADPLPDLLNQGSLKATVSTGTAEVTSSATGSGADLGSYMKLHTKIDLCPSADGIVKLSYDIDFRMTAPSGAGATLKVSYEMTKQVNDDAEYEPGTITNTQHVEFAHFGGAGGGGSFVDYTDRFAIAGGQQGAKVNRRSSGATDADVANTAEIANYAKLIGYQLAVAAEKSFQSGRCVTLNPTSTPSKRSGIKPGTSFEVFAAPRSKLDGTPTGGTVKATLSGGSSLDPAATKVKADAKFAYVGPAEKNQKASIAFEARSKRGIGKATLEFDTNNRAFTAVGGADAYHGTGTICSFSAPFTISGSGVTNTFTPTSETGGTYSYTGNMSGFAVFGHGTYTVSADEKGGTLTATGPGSVKTPMGVQTRNGTEVYKLTPAEPCG